MIFYTDGVTEAMNSEEEEFGLDPLSEFFRTNPPENPEETTAAVFDAVKRLRRRDGPVRRYHMPSPSLQ